MEGNRTRLWANNLQKLSFLLLEFVCIAATPADASEFPTGRVVKFSIESVSGQGVTKSADVRVATAEGSSLDWAATVSEIARRIVISGTAPAVKVELSSAHTVPDSHRQLAVVYYGPDKANSPWPDDPFFVTAIGHMLSPREVEYSHAFNDLEGKMQKRGMDPDKADKAASASIARKYKLSKEWEMPSTGDGVAFHALDAFSTDVGREEPELNNIIECLADANLVGTLTRCDDGAGSKPLSKLTSEKANEIIAQPGAHSTSRVIGDAVFVKFSLEPWQLTNSTIKSALYMKTANLVPAMFALSEKIGKVTIIADANFMSIKGHPSTSRYASMMFTRANSGSIDWTQIDFAKVPQLADTYEAQK